MQIRFWLYFILRTEDVCVPCILWHVQTFINSLHFLFHLLNLQFKAISSNLCCTYLLIRECLRIPYLLPVRNERFKKKIYIYEPVGVGDQVFYMGVFEGFPFPMSAQFVRYDCRDISNKSMVFCGFVAMFSKMKIIFFS